MNECHNITSIQKPRGKYIIERTVLGGFGTTYAMSKWKTFAKEHAVAK